MDDTTPITTPTPTPSLAAASTHPTAEAALQSWRERQRPTTAAATEISPPAHAPRSLSGLADTGGSGPHCKSEPVEPPPSAQQQPRVTLSDSVAAGEGTVPPLVVVVPGDAGCSATQSPASLIDSLNERQREAATASETGAVIVVAGPGSGKTRTLVARACYLVKHCKVRGKARAAEASSVQELRPSFCMAHVPKAGPQLLHR